ncbi:MAG: bifunctional hydroxymethylpyrimidine kinase/phosphomethylpyrimidine kinase [Planctomycetales bacterium]|nr:bifunctional hydroxymethylpyrimidine kinase/phosphomethylpyrimidine kinase [Planctomycetales bacterium]
MSLLVVGSLALDSVETPTAVRDNQLGGSAVYFSYAASYFSEVSLVGVVGEDWPVANTELLQSRKIDTAGLQTISGGQTFRWRGKYMENMNDRETLEVHLNVLGEFNPIVPDNYKASRFVFLANAAPAVQLKTLEQVESPQLVVADTMDLWIRETKDDLLALLKRVDGLVLNDSEAKLLTHEENVVKAAEKVLEMGPKFVVIKKGEHGALLYSNEGAFALPAYPTGDVVDPTGAGDSFAGGMMGFLAHRNQADDQTLRLALVYGTIVASFNVEDFSLERMKQISREDIDHRLALYRQMLAF